PGLGELRAEPVRHDADGHALDGGQRAVGHGVRPDTPEQAVDDEVREVVPEVDQALPPRALQVEDVGRAGRGQRELQLAEGDLVHALELDLERRAHASGRPRLERLGQHLVDRLQRPHPVLRDPRRPSEIVDPDVARRRGGPIDRRGLERRGVPRRVLPLGHRRRLGGAHWMTNWGTKTFRTTSAPTTPTTVSRSASITTGRCAMSVSSSTVVAPSASRRAERSTTSRVATPARSSGAATPTAMVARRKRVPRDPAGLTTRLPIRWSEAGAAGCDDATAGAARSASTGATTGPRSRSPITPPP